MIEWMPIADAPTDSSYEESLLLWCPDLRVSGPCVVAYLINGEWASAVSGGSLPHATHFARINPPVDKAT